MLDGVIKNRTNGEMCSIGDMFPNLVTFAPMLLPYLYYMFQSCTTNYKQKDSLAQ